QERHREIRRPGQSRATIDVLAGLAPVFDHHSLDCFPVQSLLEPQRRVIVRDKDRTHPANHTWGSGLRLRRILVDLQGVLLEIDCNSFLEDFTPEGGSFSTPNSVEKLLIYATRSIYGSRQTGKPSADQHQVINQQDWDAESTANLRGCDGSIRIRRIRLNALENSPARHYSCHPSLKLTPGQTMKRLKLGIAIVLAVPAGLFVYRGEAQGNKKSGKQSSRQYHEWRMFGGGAENILYSTLDQINRDNVHQLEVAWRFDSGDEFPGSEMQCNPIIID